MSAQAGVDLLVSPNITDIVVDWVPVGGRVCLLAKAAGAISVYLAGVRT